MTQKEARELTLEVWRYLEEHPECWSKYQLPREMYDRIADFYYECPLCELFNEQCCLGCPLHEAGENCKVYPSAWSSWANAEDEDEEEDEEAVREEAAGRIVEIVAAWEPV